MDFELLRGKAKVVFTKKNGEKRVMYCSKNLEYVPSEFHPTGTGGVKKGVVSVWDFQKSAWRSFREDSIESVDAWNGKDFD